LLTRVPIPTIAVDPSGLSPEGPWFVFGDYWGESLQIVNEDGSGLTPMVVKIFDGSNPSSIVDPLNQLAWVGSTEYLLRPERAEAIAINKEPLPYPPWERDSRFESITVRWDGKAGFLTSIHKDNEDGHFELTVHELPKGDIFDRFSAVSCDACGIGDIYWSPSERYFAFKASLEGPSHNLYVYDTLRKRLRRLTWGKETVEKINWSPHEKYLAFVLTQGGLSCHLVVYDVAEDATRRVSGWGDPVVWTRWSPAD
jgi:dipeptidyl aminopeptidase/acylaminoacyl peptidase